MIGQYYSLIHSMGSGAAAIDSDAQAFITAAGITDSTQQSAINILVTDLKGYGIWSKMKALYPLVGGTASSHKFNLKDPRDLDAAFRITWSGGVTHSTSGVLFGGSTGFGDTKLNAFSNINQNSAHISFYSRSNVAASGAGELGALTISPAQYSHMHLHYTGGIFLNLVNSTTSVQSSFITNSLGLYVANRANSSTCTSYKNGNLIAFSNSINSITPPNYNYYIGALNISGSANNFSSKESAFASIGDGLTDTEAANFYTAVQAFQTTLGRQV